jgi:choline dehydrogenase-like flavoprotein
MSNIPDPILQGLQRGWKVLGGKHGALPERLSCDVAIIGSGAGAGITAELLTKAGLNVVIVEEGPLKSSTDFKQLEPEAYASLYQENAGRKTKDKGITILQGRSVGGTTTVNWTSSFRTPPETLKFWQDRFGLKDYSVEALAPYFQQVQTRLNIEPWAVAPNENNELLRRGAAKLGIKAEVIPRNVKGCYNLGSCGMGCPTNAKQSMLVTTLPCALDRGATLLVETRVEKMVIEGSRVTALQCIAVKPNAAPAHPGGAVTTVVARHIVLAGGAINSPALLMRSRAPDPHQRLGSRTFLHPVAITTAVMAEPVQAWTGAPQSIYSDHFMHTQPVDGPMAFKLEVAPLHPVFFGANLPGFGESQAALFRQYPNAHVTLALMRDGFHPQSARRQGRAALGWFAPAGLPAHRLRAGGRAPRHAGDGADPVRGRGQDGLPRPRTRSRHVNMGRDQGRDRGPADEAPADQDRQRPRHGRLRHGRRREGRRHPS